MTGLGRRPKIKVYTGTGDYGKTSLFSGERVSKGDGRVEAVGDVDELNACLGMLASTLPEEFSSSVEEIRWIQSCLFEVGALLATTPHSPSFESLKEVREEQIKLLEAAVDRMEGELPGLRMFIFPGGHPSAAWAHVARAVCRRAERRAVHLFTEAKEEGRKEKLRSGLVFLNRLSDYLFVFARYCNQKHGIEEKTWNP